MNVIYDTNIFVSGFTRPEGRASQALIVIALEHHDLYISKPIIDELLRVLEDKFNWNPDNLAIVAEWLDDNAILIESTETLHILTDEPDNRILECALAADADLIVTGDRAMLALHSIENTRIVSLADYLDSVDNLLTSS